MKRPSPTVGVLFGTLLSLAVTLAVDPIARSSPGRFACDVAFAVMGSLAGYHVAIWIAERAGVAWEKSEDGP